MKPTQILENEHRVIEQVLDCLDKIADRCETDGRLDAESAREAVDFFRNFADRCHHGKEEVELFPLMHARGFPQEGGPVGVMRIEHDQGRAFVRGMEAAIEGAAAGNATDCRDYLKNARGFAGMLREHIKKEDHCLFPMADNALTEDDQLELRKSFERVDGEEIGPEAHARYLSLADTLADRYGVPKGRTSEGYGSPVRT